MVLSFMVLEFTQLPFCGSSRRSRRTTNIWQNGFFSIIYCEKTVRSIFIKFLGFVNHVMDYCCANFCDQQSLLRCLNY